MSQRKKQQMKRVMFFIASLIITLALDAQPAQQLADVHKIFVGSLGNGWGPAMIREKIIARLVQSGRVSIVNSAADADAVLTGVGQVTTQDYYGATATAAAASAAGGTRYGATTAIQLTSKSGGSLGRGGDERAVLAQRFVRCGQRCRKESAQGHR
jgi:hypothetical protein